MTTLDFSEGLVENTFSFGNNFLYGEKRPYGLYFCKESQNYPFILKGGLSDESELEYTWYTYQLRGRLLNTKKLKEVMNSAKIPLYFVIKQIPYLIGKGFLSTFDEAGNHQPLFMACVDGMKTISSIKQVKFYVSKVVYEDRHKAVQTAVKDIVAAHTGDVIMCNNILDYLGERLTFPRGGSLSELNKYKQAVIRTCLMQHFVAGGIVDEPFIVESNRGTISIETGPTMSSVAAAFVEREGSIESISDIVRTFRPSTSPGDIVTAMVSALMPEEISPAAPRSREEWPLDADSTLPF